jgi:hypothetical protein
MNLAIRGKKRGNGATASARLSEILNSEFDGEPYISDLVLLKDLRPQFSALTLTADGNTMNSYGSSDRMEYGTGSAGEGDTINGTIVVDGPGVDSFDKAIRIVYPITGANKVADLQTRPSTGPLYGYSRALGALVKIYWIKVNGPSVNFANMLYKFSETWNSSTGSDTSFRIQPGVGFGRWHWNYANSEFAHSPLHGISSTHRRTLADVNTNSWVRVVELIYPSSTVGGTDGWYALWIDSKRQLDARLSKEGVVPTGCSDPWLTVGHSVRIGARMPGWCEFLSLLNANPDGTLTIDITAPYFGTLLLS